MKPRTLLNMADPPVAVAALAATIRSEVDALRPPEELFKAGRYQGRKRDELQSVRQRAGKAVGQ